MRVTHPFHPWLGREFMLLGVRQSWSEERVFFLDGEDRPLKTFTVSLVQ